VVLGPQHPYTLITRYELARWTGEAAIRPLPGICSPGCCPRSSGSSTPQHPYTLAARANLTRWTGEANGEPSTA
jgi:hypothetical protein